MSEDMLCLVFTFLILGLMFAWVPLLNFICPPCGRALERFWSKKASPEERLGGVSAINPGA